MDKWKDISTVPDGKDNSVASSLVGILAGLTIYICGSYIMYVVLFNN